MTEIVLWLLKSAFYGWVYVYIFTLLTRGNETQQACAVVLLVILVLDLMKRGREQ